MSDTLTPLATDTALDSAGRAVPDAAIDTTDETLVEDQLVEEISIDGMCGVY